MNHILLGYHSTVCVFVHTERKMVVKSGLLPPGNSQIANDGSPPPQVPPRMKKKRGPALPEKPPHLKSGGPPSSQQDLKDIKREVLVAASKGARERPVDKRQREPAKLLVQISKGGADTKSQDVRVVVKDPLRERLRPLQDVNKGQDRKPHKPLQDDPRLIRGPQLDPRKKSTGPRVLLPAPRGSDPRKMMLIPVSEWRSSAVWRPPPQQQVVVRTGSLTSQEGSSGSDSETFPKSALKKQRLRSSGRKGGKNVTFNAFATVQVMEA